MVSKHPASHLSWSASDDSPSSLFFSGCADALDRHTRAHPASRYAFNVEAGFDEGETWRYMAREYPPLFSLLIFFGVVAGTLGHWLQKRASSPSRELQRALEAGEFEHYLQPVVHSDSKRWAGVEVLMRWNPPRKASFARTCSSHSPNTAA